MPINLSNKSQLALTLFARILTLLLAAIFAQFGYAQTNVMPQWQLQYFDGPENCDAVDEVVKPQRSANWRTLDPGQVVQRKQQLWMRLITVKPLTLQSGWIVSIRRVGLLRLRYHFYAPAAGETQSAWLDRTKPNRPFDFATNVLAVKLPPTLSPGESLNFCIPVRVSVSSNMLAFEPESAFRARDLRQAMFETACLTIMLSMVVSALFFAVTLKDTVYLWYVGHIAAFAIFELRVTAEIFRWFAGWPFMPDFAYVLSDFLIGISIFCASRFAMVFLDTPRHFPKVSVWLARTAWAVLIASFITASFRPWIIANPLNPLSGLLPDLQNLLTAIICLTVLVLAFGLSWLRNKAANYYLASSLPLVLGGIVATLYAILIDSSASFTPFLLPLAAFEAVVLSLGMADRALSLRHERDDARNSAEHDLLTGQLNRRGFSARLDQAHQRLQQAPKETCALLYCDLDFFKRVNDEYGHEAGDQCLKHFAEAVKAVLRVNKDRRRARRTDDIGRMGGEEFVVLLYHCSAENALHVAERICTNLRESRLRWGNSDIALTVSIGVALLRPGVEPKAALAAADAALYRAKHEGRDRVCLAE